MISQGINQRIDDHQRMGQSQNEWMGERMDIFTNESAGLALTQPINRRTNEPIDGSFTVAPLNLPTNELANQAVNETPYSTIIHHNTIQRNIIF